MSKERIYTVLAVGFAFMQTMIPTLKLNDTGTTIATVICVTLAAIFTIKKQRISIEVNDNAVRLTWVLIAIAALGGLNELIGAIYVDIEWQERLRGIIAILIGLLNISSKNLFPTEAGKEIEATKIELKEDIKVTT